MLLIALFAQMALVVVALALLAFVPVPSRRALACLSGGIFLFLAGFASIASWVYPPRWFALVYLLVFAFISVWRWKRTPGTVGSPFGGRAALVAALLAAIAGVGMGYLGVKGRFAPAGPVIALFAPLPSGQGFCALSAGNALPLNLHYLVGPTTGVPGERHSVDFTRLNSWGLRTTVSQSFDPKPVRPAHYAVYGAEVQAPCSGRVIEAVGERPDNPAGSRYRDFDGANRVVLRCEGVDVMLAHLQQGSVRHSPGQQVRTSDVMGRVGNSGNTEEPHLHIDAQTLSGDGEGGRQPVVMRFEGRYLAKGDCL